MEAVTAKFKVSRHTDMGWGSEVELTPDYAQGRNQEWAAATPAGMCRLTLKSDDPALAAFFAEGRPLTLTFTPDEGE